MRTTVLKFGGTSLGAPEAIRNALAVTRARAAVGPTIVVVSAPAGVTDTLSSLLDGVEAGTLPPDTLEAVLQRLRPRCLSLLHDSTAGEFPLDSFPDIDALRHQLLSATSRVAPLTWGERTSAALFTALLERGGTPARTLDAARIIAVEGDPLHGRGDVEGTRRRLHALRWIRDSRESGAVLVVPGFYGSGADGVLRLLGRGGSDTSATLLGAALDAHRVEIWSDVDGVYSTDPRSNPSQRPIAFLDFHRAQRLARGGARILHPESVAPAWESGVPVVVRNTFRPTAPGSWIGGRLRWGGAA